jgi:hypothetical protein
MTSNLESGIHTEVLPDGLRVTWIDWDSGFRTSGLDVGDYIVGVDGTPLSLDRLEHPKAVGQYLETQLWEAIGATADRPITLNAVRDGKPFDVQGKLHAHYFYTDAEGKTALAPGGPLGLVNDGFDGAWSRWLEESIKAYSYALLRMWVQSSNTRTKFAEHLATKDRIDFLLKKYSGPFADAMLEDWTRVMTCLQGKKIELTDTDLEYRALGERRKAIAKQAAATAWEALRKEATGQAFPVPSIADRQHVVGSVVELPQVTYRDILNDLGQAFMAIGSPSDGYYFLALETRELFRFYEVMYRYKGQINPTMPEKYRWIARVKNDLQMITVRGRAQTGLMLELVAGMAGDDECCVDLRADPPRFAGEDQLSSFAPIALQASEPPERVIEAMIQAVKLGDDKAWRSLFADWRTVAGAGGRETIDASYAPRPAAFADEWERSRKNIMGEVLDARVERVEAAWRVLERLDGLPEVEQVRVWVDHFGRFDGEVRAFKSLSVRREWILQRLNGGPWKIVSLQHL